ncbi:hypothetical protein AKJ61_02350 [candidate division MSBL1 archaeon SCGC-AAA259B11]|uniref:Uncharacterized protein n=1 Tax=candidate division MSBL1 archaeon SCGC-AAA259B11 TaxID=1698260 RepID=A0A133U675_9EURY|nr:hypothetical protein AKJ61_02350 [candidate division MSBL1 archaeon SCGC-AAA259B11]
MEKKLAVALSIGFFIAGFVAASSNPVRSWLEHNWPEPSIGKDKEFFRKYLSREMQMENFQIINVGKFHPVHPWHQDPSGAYAVVRVGNPRLDRTYFLWYDNPLEKDVSQRVFGLRGEKERDIAKTLYRFHPNFAITGIMDLEDWIKEVPFPVGRWGWTGESGAYVAEYVRPPNYGFYGGPPPRPDTAMLLTENGRIVDNKKIYRAR